MATESKPPLFTAKDYLTISLSLIALGLSLTSFYFSNVRIEDNLQARVIDAGVTWGSDSLQTDQMKVTVAYVNAGNRDAIVLAPMYHVADTTNFDNGATGAEVVNKGTFPLILKPREMKLVDLEVPFAGMDTVSAKVVATNDRGRIYQSYLALEFYGLDSKAQLHDERSGFHVQIWFQKSSFHTVSAIETRSNTPPATIIFKE